MFYGLRTSYIFAVTFSLLLPPPPLARTVRGIKCLSVVRGATTAAGGRNRVAEGLAVRVVRFAMHGPHSQSDRRRFGSGSFIFYVQRMARGTGGKLALFVLDIRICLAVDGSHA